MDLAERTKIAFEKTGKRKSAIEKEARLPKGYMTRILSGERKNLGPGMMSRLADALKVKHEWLASGDGKPEGVYVLKEDPGGFAEVYETESPLETLLNAFAWPPELEPEQAGEVVKRIREEHQKSSEQLPQSYWATRLQRLIVEVLGKAKDAHRREVAEPVDTTQESPEVRGGRKKPKRL